jgi:hypothetical protein
MVIVAPLEERVSFGCSKDPVFHAESVYGAVQYVDRSMKKLEDDLEFYKRMVLSEESDELKQSYHIKMLDNMLSGLHYGRNCLVLGFPCVYSPEEVLKERKDLERLHLQGIAR